jgi:adenine-specific DNA-methyltransferase
MTELVWDGKYIDGKRQSPSRIALPFQTIETVNESAVDRQRNLELFSVGRETEWRNRLIWGDKKYVLPSLLPEFAGKVDLIYIDPPFDTGADFSYNAAIPNHDTDDETVAFRKQPSIIEQKAYRDTWGRGFDSYLKWFYDTALLLRELLCDNGTIYVHLDWHVGSYAKVVLDEVFGLECCRNEVVWKRQTAHSDPKRYGPIHETIYCYGRSPDPKFRIQYVPYDQSYIDSHYGFRDPDGRRYQLGDLTARGPRPGLQYTFHGVNPPPGRVWTMLPDKMEELFKAGRIVFTTTGTPRRKRYLDEMLGVPLQDLWTDINPVNSQALEATEYPTQKPEALLERIIRASSDEGDLILDCFAGSGTTGAVAEKLNRRWIACDLSRFAIHTARKRLLLISNVKPFAVQNLGKYERQAWQTAEFPSSGPNKQEEERQREAAYRNFILDLYHARCLTGYGWLHGVKSGRMVHVGAVDAPVTIADVKSVAREVWKATGKDGASRKAAADILGWDFAFELNETARQVAAESRVDVTFKKIPREVLEKKAVEQGDIKFFELGALSVKPEQRKRELTISLTEFVIPMDDVPEDARKFVKHWSQMIDYWAVDWDFRNDTFHNQWQSYRTRQTPKIELSAKYEYPQPGSYKVVVKVIDILGNDTTKTLDVKVK